MGIDTQIKRCYKNGIKRVDEFSDDFSYNITFYDEHENIVEKINKIIYDYEEILYLRNGHLMLEEIIVKGKIIKSIEYYKIMDLTKEDTMEYEKKLFKCIKSIDEIELSQW